MSAPLIWIAIPAALSLILLLLRVNRTVVTWIGVLTSLWLFLLALLLPVEEVITFGARTFKLNESFFVLGREFILSDTDRPFLALMFFFQAGWVAGSFYVRPNDLFVPITFAMGALLNAALAVEPFLYAALLIEISVLIAIPMLSPADKKPGRGIFRFLAFQTFGMPFILLSGFFLSGLEASPGQTELVTQSAVLLGIGFAFILAVVPFHSWVPMLSKESNPFTVAYVLFIITGMVSLFGIGFFDRFVWLRDSESAYLLIRLVGSFMVLVSGVWAAFEDDWGRMLGYYIIAETGFSLLAIGMHSPQGILIFFWFMVVRFFALLFWAGGMSIIKKRTHGNLDLKSLAGFGHLRPLLVGGTLAAQLSIIGTPFLASFPARFALWQGLSMIDIASAGIALLGNIGLLAAALRILNTLFIQIPGEGHPRKAIIDILSPAGALVSDRVFNWLLFSLMVGILILVGNLPRIFLPWMEKFLLMFSQLGS